MYSVNNISNCSKSAKMDQVQSKTHKIQKKWKNEEAKKVNNKNYLLFIEENSRFKGFNFPHKNNQYSHTNILSSDESTYNSSSNTEIDKKTQQSDIFDNFSSSALQLTQKNDQLYPLSSVICQNNTSQMMNQKYYQLNATPIILIEPSESKCFCLYNEVVLDFDLLDEYKYIYQKSLTQVLSSFKKVNQIQKLNNGDLIEVQQESFSNPILEFTFLINQLKSLNNSEAYRWSQALHVFQQKTQSQINYITSLKQQEGQSQKLKNLFAQRKQFAFQKAQKLSKLIPRNQYCMYIVYNFDYESLTVRQSHTGYSRKLLDIMGISMQDAPSVFLRKGPLDLINKKTHTWNMLLAAIQLTGHPKQEVIDIAEGETFIQTLDDIQLHAKISIKTNNLTFQYDSHNNIDLPIQDDMMVEIFYEIDEENLTKFYKKRKEKRILESFSIYDIIDGEFEYLMEVENFLQKYYEANISSLSQKKKAEFDLKNKQKNGVQNQCLVKSENNKYYSLSDSHIISKNLDKMINKDSSINQNVVIIKGNLKLSDDQDPTVLI
ncbi:hypothetical protein TTHERM_00666190 (macronuclear) [Tetrahymena thermophila SB210]|uniref:Uncharacterized protein n=1 Tax=Tetrahymena thermophila (strain SB210) TaxID=312017 RepID=Q23TG3_TETTS|nr:hypothetical protein TTHERM_00666190 [Tetrahymena thermophila SB210]EAR99743.1 hypothetical protein TTHERM_00666190 [Tetrahymena thermophila SB210]|eukprot:XP_001019988.1 hypothetical protein TTHERM_00666190 [Tetrahymena thermophila SB210]